VVIYTAEGVPIEKDNVGRLVLDDQSVGEECLQGGDERGHDELPNVLRQKPPRSASAMPSSANVLNRGFNTGLTAMLLRNVALGSCRMASREFRFSALLHPSSPPLEQRR
jgi:hypothetical protein